MKILAFSHTGLDTGGAEQCLLEYIDVLKVRGHECKVIMPHEGAMQMRLAKNGIQSKIIGYGWAIRPHKKVNIHQVMASNGNSLTKIFQEVEKYKPDVILVNTSVIPWGLYAGRILGIPTVMLVHEIINEKDPSLQVLPNYQEYMDILNANADVVVYNSEFVRKEFNRDLTKPTTPNDILYPLPPLSIENINEAYQENKIEDILKIAIFGALAPRKNQLEAVKAIKILRDEGIENVQLDLYGDIAANLPYVKILRKYIEQNALGEFVRLKGFSKTVYKTMNKYNIILSTSTYEPFGRTIVEGQLFGRLAVANNTGGGKELIEHKKTGLIYTLGNPKHLAQQILWILNHKDEAEAIAVKTKAIQAKRFLTTSRYSALTNAIEVLSKTTDKQQRVASDLFNPIRSLYEYNHTLNERYKNIERFVNNRYVRALKNTSRRVMRLSKRLVKELLAFKVR